MMKKPNTKPSMNESANGCRRMIVVNPSIVCKWQIIRHGVIALGKIINELS